MKRTPRNPEFGRTAPLADKPGQRFPTDPTAAVTAYAPPNEDLVALSAKIDWPESSERPSLIGGRDSRERLRDTLPPGAPEWMRWARLLMDELEELLRTGHASADQELAIQRAYLAYALAGASSRQILRVAHLVSRAHTALRDMQRNNNIEVAYRDAAEVLFRGLPSPLRRSMPFERVVLVVRHLRQEADPWAAVVEGTAELLGWKDLGRMHAASVIRFAIENAR